MPYFGQYTSTTVTRTGCVKQFVTVRQDTLLFPSNVEYDCDLCGDNHTFRLMRQHTVSTPNQHRQFDEYCINQSLERDVNL
jgi:hypothetical protein